MSMNLLPTGHEPIHQLEMIGIVKRFPGVLAADHIDFDVKEGEVHALLGENGAGKSTLMKILYGLYHADEGQILINGLPSPIKHPHAAIDHGIGMIHQHFMLVPSLTVAENIALGMKSSRGFRLDLDVVSRRAMELSEIYNLKIDPDLPIWQLAVGEQQRVEILRALYKGAALLILDEPTAVLTPQEVDGLFRILNQLADEGHALVFISHKLQEVLEISQRITVLRDGHRVDTIPTSEATKPKLAEMMVGRPVLLEYHKNPANTRGERLILDGLSALSNRGTVGLDNVSLRLHGGEIVGIAGVSGNGQHELAQCITGLRHITSGNVTVDGKDITNLHPSKLEGTGLLSYIPEERMIDGVIKEFTVAENFVLHDHGHKEFTRGGIFMRFGRIKEACQRAIKDYEIKTPSSDTLVKNLSGGNIQKLVLARELSRNPSVLIAAQPTRGVDIGATEYIHQRLLEERDKGIAILLISEDLDEIRALSDRIVVMYEGQIVGEMENVDIDVEHLGMLMMGETATAKHD